MLCCYSSPHRICVKDIPTACSGSVTDCPNPRQVRSSAFTVPVTSLIQESGATQQYAPRGGYSAHCDILVINLTTWLFSVKPSEWSCSCSIYAVSYSLPFVQLAERRLLYLSAQNALSWSTSWEILSLRYILSVCTLPLSLRRLS